MTIIVNKADLLNMLFSIQPHYSLDGNKNIKGLGYWGDGLQWYWDVYNLKKLSSIKIYEVYKLCRNSHI